MLSRIADSLFWLNRYIERSDCLVRLVYVHYILSMDRSDDTNNSWRPVLELCTLAAPGEIKTIEYDTPAVLKKLLLDKNNDNSVLNIVNKARENARGAQDHITKEVWEVVNQMYHLANQADLSAKLGTDQAAKVIEAFSRSSVLFAGITDNTMSRGLGWNFLQLGKFIERCFQTIAITNKQLETMPLQKEKETDILQWRYLLLSLSGYELHLKTYRSPDHTANVLQQIFLDENFTRSIVYSLIRIGHYLENIMLIHEDQNKTLNRAFGKMFSKVRYLDIGSADICELQRLLQEINADLLSFSNQLGQYYFSYS
jgi:uncharacterized alpha-E superfamily protein